MKIDPATQIFLEVVQKLSTTRSLEEITTMVRTAARQLANADGATFVLKDGPYCFYVDEDALSPLWKGQRFLQELCISGWSMNHKSSVVIEDIYADPRIPHDAYRPTFVKSLLIVPIHAEDPIGAIGVYWAEHHLPTPTQIEALQALAGAVSVAMENVRLYEEQQKRIEELKASNQAKDEFLMLVSHELRTPLNAILGWSQSLSKNTGLNDDLKRGLEIIERSASAQTRIVEDLLDGSQIVLGHLKLKRELVNLDRVLEDAALSLQFEASQRKINISVVREESSVNVYGDSQRLQQVFCNLIANAVKFSENGGDILIHLTTEGPSAKVHVIDHGIGIDPVLTPYIFERFRQVDSSTTRKHRGLGLGLAIVKHLVDEHYGTVGAFSEGLGMGTTLTVTIPLAGETLSPAPTTPLPSVANSNPRTEPTSKHVLIVDDEIDSLNGLEKLLKLSGFHVSTATSVSSALSVAA
ncbi:MAG TPA: ATP-binding protein, partial [Bdellovibrionota bacterium]|nr:ATP-binding protein [Bdellovibrionota bacterium]